MIKVKKTAYTIFLRLYRQFFNVKIKKYVIMKLGDQN